MFKDGGNSYLEELKYKYV